ncbi:cation-translocating P-type ATPase [Desulfocurvibacter africanus]|uniref:cation-translocating P-type ATPase n=1 Tax=Desulfocurvibacter africanus TaxID=873 RepID=UPI0004103AEC|nr:HAD-IC family P-type ATPase [Desulfocurvibacter africanus]
MANTDRNAGRAEWHAQELDKVLERLETDRDGLSPDEAEKRLDEHGPNALEGTEGKSLLGVVLKQLKSPLIYLLAAAAAVSLLAGKTIDTIVIAVVVLLNTILGVVQEYRAERALEALKKMSAPRAKVRRGGKGKEVESRDIVPGDILLVESGDSVAADARLIEASELKVDESALTGESEPVDKKPDRVEADAPVSERGNMLFMSTHVTGGRGRAVVVATGMDTEMGNIAGEVRQAERGETPLQRRLRRLSIAIGVAAVGLAGGVFALGYFTGYEWREMLLYSVAVAVSAIPEGLPVVISVTLALGVRRMADRNAVIRQLPAVETLGSTTVICSDKTGTITKNQMTAVRLWAGGRFYEVTGQGFSPDGEIRPESGDSGGQGGSDGSGNFGERDKALDMLMRIGVLDNHAEIAEADGGWKVDGSPTEGAVLVAGIKHGLDYEEARKKHPAESEIPFSSERKYMASLHRFPDEGRDLILVKGAPERILEFCSRVLEDGESVELGDERRREIQGIYDELAGQGLRVVAGAFREHKQGGGDIRPENVEDGLILAGMWGLVDPARPEAVQAIADARRAGMKVVMITGDHAATARAIARKVGIAEEGDEVLTGKDIDFMSDEDLGRRAKGASVFARVSPEHKVRILRAYLSQGEIVAMTGDGVNDAPALKGASIGVAMGQAGTEVAREASDMVLTDDNFATIVVAVEEGRSIFGNLRRVVFFLLTTNLGEIITLIAALALRLPLPVTAVMILWINLLTDGVSTVPLGVEPRHGDLLDRPPRSPEEGILNKATVRRIALLAPIMAAGTLGLFVHQLPQGENYARTMAFTTLAAFQWFQALNARSHYRSIFSLNPLGNRWLVLGLAVAIMLQLATVYLEPLRQVFGTVQLSPMDWGLAILVASSILAVDEIMKLIGLHERPQEGRQARSQAGN